MRDLTYNGTFNLILGNMWSGKTTELLRRYRRYSVGNKECLLIKYKGDTRYDNKMVVTHDNVKVEAFVCDYLYEADPFIEKYDVICIDEVQFYKDADIFIDLWANMGKIVEACGLNGTFNRTEFDIISKLIPLVDDIAFFKAVCKETGNDAIYSDINVNVTDNSTEIISTEIIGGDEKYSAVDRKTYFKNKTNYINKLINRFVPIYSISKGKRIDNNILERIDCNIPEIVSIAKECVI